MILPDCNRIRIRSEIVNSTVFMILSDVLEEQG